MSFYKILHFIFGETVFGIEKRDFARLSTLLSKKRITVWGISPQESRIELHVSLFASSELVSLLNESSIPFEITQKRGIPFLFSRYKKRYGMLLGLVCGLFLLFYNQLFVWKITVSGNDTVTTAEIENALSGIGISVGSFIPNIDVQGKANELLMDFREISSAAISIRGTHLHISVLERAKIPEIVDKSGFYNVVADRDGVVIDIDAADGTPEVKQGDAVYKGELLINSFIEGTNGSFRPTHARGIVYAAVNEYIVTKIPLERVSKSYTGKSEKKTVYRILGCELPFSSLECDYEYFDAVASEQDIKLFSFIELPIKRISVLYTEYELNVMPIDVATAEKIANETLRDTLDEYDCEILSLSTEFVADEKNGICILHANAVLKLDIARESPFEIIDYKMPERLTMASE